MKIAFLNIYSGLVERGAEVFTHEIAEVLGVNNQVDVYQIGYRSKVKNYGQIVIKKIPYIKSQGIFYHLTVLWFTLKLIPFLLIKKYDWIIPINGSWQVLLVRLVRFFTKSRILISGHAGVGKADLLNLIVGTPDVFVALSPTAYTWAKKNYPLGHIQYIPNGININEFEKPYPRLNLEIPKPVVLCVSALLKYKRIELLIKAVSKTKASLVVIGDGPLREELGILGKTFLNHRFKLIPHISHEDIAAYYQACDIFSLPSAPTEAFGLVYLEALASNLPVVAPDDNSRKIIIGGCGVLCNVEDSKAYGLAIEKVLTTNYGNKPREQAQKYSWENIGLQYEKLLNEKLNLYENKV